MLLLSFYVLYINNKKMILFSLSVSLWFNLIYHNADEGQEGEQCRCKEGQYELERALQVQATSAKVVVFLFCHNQYSKINGGNLTQGTPNPFLESATWMLIDFAQLRELYIGGILLIVIGNRISKLRIIIVSRFDHLKLLYILYSYIWSFMLA